MPYPEFFVAPMRAELTRLGFEDLKTPEAVDAAVQQPGTTMIVVNSVCGCAAGKARPGIALALGKGKRPDHLGTVFAGADVEATQTARAHFAPYPPSSPSIALLKDGKLVYMMERRDIEGRSADMIAGVAVCGLAVTELTVREHLAGYRSHTLLLSFLPVVALQGLVSLTRPSPALQFGVLAIDFVVFIVLFQVWQSAYKHASGRKERS